MIKILWPKKIIEAYKDEIDLLTERCEELRTAKGVVEDVLSREIVWMDKDKMNEPDRLRWSNEAKALMDNMVFQSLVGRTDKDGIKTNGEIVKNLIEGIARDSGSYDEVKFLRATINGIELIRQYAEELVVKRQRETKDNVYDAV